MSNRKIVYVGFAFTHHKGTHAGYQQIRDHVPYDMIVDTQKYIEKHLYQKKNTGVKLFGEKVCLKLFNARCVPYWILKCMFYSLLHKNTVFHFIYSESLFLPFRRFIFRGAKAVCTVHQPIEVLEKWKLTKGLKRADTIILVGNQELNAFKLITGRDNVYYIPHGISSDFYKPEMNVKKKHILLTVGSWLRDYNFANLVYQKILELDKNIEIKVVTNPQNRDLVTANKRISFLTGITDEQLKELYLESSALFLPLIRYTANNSLLEAGACGCNIVIASDFPDNSYIPERMVTLCPMDVMCAVNSIIRSMTNKYNTELATYVDSKYSWATIGQETHQLLMSI